MLITCYIKDFFLEKRAVKATGHQLAERHPLCLCLLYTSQNAIAVGAVLVIIELRADLGLGTLLDVEGSSADLLAVDPNGKDVYKRQHLYCILTQKTL